MFDDIIATIEQQTQEGAVDLTLLSSFAILNHPGAGFPGIRKAMAAVVYESANHDAAIAEALAALKAGDGDRAIAALQGPVLH